MRFSINTIATAVLAISSSTYAALTAKQIADNINTLTTKSQSLIAPAKSLTLLNAVQVVPV
jgi:hypothetical protein